LNSYPVTMLIKSRSLMTQSDEVEIQKKRED
jgi:hypothetical protein